MFDASKITRFFLSLGIINHIVFLGFVFSVCSLTGYTCRGDEGLSLVTVYGYLLAGPQLIVELASFTVFTIIVAKPNTRTKYHSYVLVFTVTLVMSIFGSQLL